MSATFTKLKDNSWGLRVINEQPTEGGVIAVTKKDGSRSTSVVGKILWKDPASLTFLCTIKEATASAPRRGHGIGRYCAECGEKIKSANQRCWETGGDCYPD